MNRYLFIDHGYYSFYRIYATQRWYKFSHREENIIDNEYNWINNSLFMEKLKQMYEKTLIELSKKYQIDLKNIYICLDCGLPDNWRLEHYTEYKKNRNVESNMKDIFNILYNDILINVSNKYTINILKCDRCEADDIIGTILLNDTMIEKGIVITSDMDYLQLIKNNIELYDLKGNSLIKKSIGTADKDLLLKILMGDKSDNITSVFNKCGIKTAMKYIENKELLLKKLTENDLFKEKYNLNKKIIDINEIPIELKDNILEIWKNIKN